MSDFNTSSVYANVQEIKFNVALERAGINNRRVPHNQQGEESYDIITDAGVRFELKNDIRAKDTGNFAIEIRNDKNESGLAVTTADYWVLASEDTNYVVSTKKLSQRINGLLRRGSKDIRFLNDFPVSQGYGTKRMSMYLIAIEQVAEIASEVGTYRELNFNWLN